MLARIATIALSLVGTCAAYGQQAPYLISRHAVGPVVLEAPAQIVYERVPDHELIDLALEGYLTPALALTLPGLMQRGGVIAELIPRDGHLLVYRIDVRDPALRTEKGIGVGSTVDQLRAAYDIDSLGYGEAGFYVRVDELAASFLLDGGDRGWRDESAIPGDLRVVSVLLTP